MPGRQLPGMRGAMAQTLAMNALAAQGKNSQQAEPSSQKAAPSWFCVVLLAANKLLRISIFALHALAAQKAVTNSQKAVLLWFCRLLLAASWLLRKCTFALKALAKRGRKSGKNLAVMFHSAFCSELIFEKFYFCRVYKFHVCRVYTAII